MKDSITSESNASSSGEIHRLVGVIWYLARPDHRGRKYSLQKFFMIPQFCLL
jgi:hypothetical protein